MASEITVNFPADLPVIETPRLRLRPFALADAAEVQSLAGDQAVAETTLSIPHPYADGVAEAWIGSHVPKWAAHEELALAITRKPGGELLGSISLMVQPGTETGQLGYWVGVPHWNQGYTSEAARAVINYGFRTLGLSRIEAHHLAQNLASGRVMEKAGMHREAFTAQAVRKDGVLRDVVFYGVNRTDWPESG